MKKRDIYINSLEVPSLACSCVFDGLKYYAKGGPHEIEF